MLIAPAGYGKTTLAEQWVARDGRVGIWYTARSASTDVAALALGIARAATAIIDDSRSPSPRAPPRAARAGRERPDTRRDPERGSRRVARQCVARPRRLPRDHAGTEGRGLRRGTRRAVSPVQFLIASRVRPRWVASKRVMYGDVLEIEPNGTRNGQCGGCDRARGSDGAIDVRAWSPWPMAGQRSSVSQASPRPRSMTGLNRSRSRSTDSSPTKCSVLLDRTSSGDLQRSPSHRCLIKPWRASYSVLTRRQRLPLRWMSASSFRGAGSLDLHPLARVFLEDRAAQLDLAPSGAAASTCLDTYLRESRVGCGVRTGESWPCRRHGRAHVTRA